MYMCSVLCAMCDSTKNDYELVSTNVKADHSHCKHCFCLLQLLAACFVMAVIILMMVVIYHQSMRLDQLEKSIVLNDQIWTAMTAKCFPRRQKRHTKSNEQERPLPKKSMTTEKINSKPKVGTQTDDIHERNSHELAVGVRMGIGEQKVANSNIVQLELNSSAVIDSNNNRATCVGHSEPTKLYNNWRKADWMSQNDAPDSDQLGRGVVTVTMSGLAMIYSQVTYRGTNPVNGYDVNLNDNSLYRCVVSANDNTSVKVNSCFSAKIVKVMKGDKLTLTDVEHGRSHCVENHETFFGIVMLSPVT